MISASRTAIAALAFLFGVGAAMADDKPAGGHGPDAAKVKGDELVKALKETPGCLGVETAQTSSGKAVIFAFFENKKAVLKWFYSPTHRQMVDSLGGDYDGKRRPMKDIPDDVPVMAVASIKFGGKPAAPNLKIPVSQIAIELYTPLSKGLSIGGSFAPEAFRDLAPNKGTTATKQQ